MVMRSGQHSLICTLGKHVVSLCGALGLVKLLRALLLHEHRLLIHQLKLTNLKVAGRDGELVFVSRLERLSRCRRNQILRVDTEEVVGQPVLGCLGSHTLQETGAIGLMLWGD